MKTEGPEAVMAEKRRELRIASGLKALHIPHRPIRWFLAVSIIFGSLMALLIPPFQIPDELTHFTRSYEVSELKTPTPYTINGTHHLGSMLPRSISDTYKITELRRVSGAPNVPQAKKYYLLQTAKSLRVPLNPSQRSFFDTGSTPNYFPLVYLPQAIVIKVLALLHVPILIMLYATRFVGLGIWVALATISLKMLRKDSQKLALGVVLLIPMFLAQASASTDPLINGLMLLTTVLAGSSFIYKKKMSRWQYAFLLLALSIAVLSKPVYAAFGLLLLVPGDKTMNIKQVSKKLSLLLVPLMVLVIWTVVGTVHGGPYYNNTFSNGASPRLQAEHVIPNVLNFFEPFVNTLLLGWGDSVWTSIIGDFGQLDTPLPILYVIAGYVLITTAAFTSTEGESDESQRLGPLKLVAICATGGLYIVGIFLAMYIYSTPPDVPVITGVQGRYLLPLLPLIVMFGSKRIVVIREKAFNGIILILPLALAIASLVVIYFRYYTVYP